MRTRAAAMLFGLTLIAACGGTTTAKTSTGGTTVSASPSGPTVGGSLTVNKTYWYAGFKVTLGKVTVLKAITPTPPTYAQVPEEVTIEATFENTGPDNFTPYNEDLVLQSGTNSYLNHDSRLEKIPAVPGLQTTSGIIAFQVDEKFNLNKSELLIGNANFNQAMVPIGGNGKYVSLEPQKVAANGTVTLPDAFTLAVSGGDLSYDNAKQHGQQKAGEANLVLHFSLTSNKDNACCFSSDNADLKLPDGTAIVATAGSCCSIGPKGTTTPDDFVAFVFKTADGAYDFIVKGKYGASGAEEQGDLPFNITLGQSAAPGATPSVPGSLGPTAEPQATPSGH